MTSLDPHVAVERHELVAAVAGLLRHHGIVRSEVSLLDLIGCPLSAFNLDAAVQVFESLGLAAALGPVQWKDTDDAYLPLLGFDAEGVPWVVNRSARENHFSLTRFSASAPEHVEVSKNAISEKLSNQVLLVIRPAQKASGIALRHGHFGGWLWPAFTQSKGLYVQVILAAAVSNILGLSTSLFVMVVYDRIVPNEAVESLIALTIGVTIALCFDFVIKSLRVTSLDYASKRADTYLSRLIFDRLLALPSGGRKRRSGALASIVREFDTLRDFFTSATLVAFVDLPFVFLFIWVIYLIAGSLAWVPLLALPLVVVATLIIQPVLARLASVGLQSAMSKQSVLIETLNGLETIRVAGLAGFMRMRFSDASLSQSDLGFQSRVLSQLAQNIAIFVQQGAQVVTVFVGTLLIRDDVITMGAMIAAVILGSRALAPLGQITAALSRYNAAVQSYQALDGLMQEAGSSNEAYNHKYSLPLLRGEISLKGVSYKFPGSSTEVLRDITVTIPAGQKVAVLGRTGSGKSTLARIMAGVLEPTTGQITLDGVKPTEIDPADLTRNIGVMLQESWLFSGTLKENILCGRTDLSDAQLLEIVRLSGLSSILEQHPAGLATQVGERGEGLSGGQRQAICMARAIVNSPSILICDEPTSALDVASEQSLILRLKPWLEGRTAVIVTHRSALMSLVDRVIVVEGGQISADTTPDKFLTRSAAVA